MDYLNLKHKPPETHTKLPKNQLKIPFFESNAQRKRDESQTKY